MPENDLQKLSIDTIRTLAMDAVQKANAGHPGTPMSTAPMAYALWTRYLKHNPTDPKWFDRDRFVLSAGHASMLLYSLLYLTGYGLTLDDLKNFRQFDSHTPGHPEYGHIPGVEVTTGPLGQGFAMGVGMAIAEAFLAARYNKPGFDLVDHYTYALCSDGDLMEGISSEAASLAGTLGLGKMVYLYDKNNISIEGDTDMTFLEDVGARFEAYGWHVQHVADGEDVDAIAKAIEAGRNETSRPSLIIIKTVIAHGSPHKAGLAETHGAPLGEDEVKATKRAYGWPEIETFRVPGEALEFWRQAIGVGEEREAAWLELMGRYAAQYPAEAAEFRMVSTGVLPDGWDDVMPEFPADEKGLATRSASGRVLNAIAAKLPTMIGGSADLAPSNDTYLKDLGDFHGDSPTGRNMRYGVREHAMGAIVNGMAQHGGIIPYAGTFLVFSDYMRGSIRIGSLMHAHSIFVYTHDSIGLGEDGPTHQPIEHLASLRAMPNLTLIRPADANETAEAWRLAIGRKGPTALALTRQAVPVLGHIDAMREGVKRGGYVLADAEGGSPDVILIATGSEVWVAMKARELLSQRGIGVRVVSLPSWEIFEEQSQAYRDEVLPPAVRARVSVEAAATFGWQRWVTDDGAMVGIDHFGASAPGSVVLKQFGFTPENVAEKAEAVLKKLRPAAAEVG
jgi:transketolase